MKQICDDLKTHVPDVIAEWHHLVVEQPWFLLPPEDRIDALPNVVVGLVEAALCDPHNREAHRKNVDAAAQHGGDRRNQCLPEHLILTEYHLLRLAIWRYLTRKFGASSRTAEAIMQIDIAITVATNASMWGYHRAEIEAIGKWEEGMERIVSSSPLLQR